jgi:hypothetical protein
MTGPNVPFGNGATNPTPLSPWSIIAMPNGDWVTNSILVAKPSTVNGLARGVLTPEETCNLDIKIDDGNIASDTYCKGGKSGRFRGDNTSDGVVNEFCYSYDFNGKIGYMFPEVTNPVCYAGLALN